MNSHVNAISGRLSLRAPQRQSLEILDRVTEIVPPGKDGDIATALKTIQSEYPSVTDFERDFPSLCFALATGVGKTRLMGAFISYLHLAHGINNFFVMAPNLTIYNKLIADFTPNTPKYVFKGISEFAQTPPEIITGEDYEAKAGTMFSNMLRCNINIFNISKINSEVRGGKSPRIKRLSEYIGQSYFEYLAGLPDLVLLMDESHRYRASAGVRAINELKPVLGLELTATPYLEGPRGTIPFKNVVYEYSLAKAMQDGFVKEPAVATQKNFDSSKHTPEALEKIKLEDGVRLHEDVKVQLETYARQNDKEIVKPFVLVIARDTTHAAALLELIQSEKFFEGRYRDKVIQVDSSKSGAEEEEMIARLLKVEYPKEPTEIVIHVNMLKEGWDVTNLYTIVPLRAANARVLIEQSIGRGLRLPYGKRTGVSAVDRLSIVAHDRFQEIVDEANRADSQIRMQTILLESPEAHQRQMTVVSKPSIISQVGGVSFEVSSSTSSMALSEKTEVSPVFATKQQQSVAQAALKVIRSFERLPNSSALLDEEVQTEIVRQVAESVIPRQTEIEGIAEEIDVEKIVKDTTRLVIQQTIDIPCITVLPKGEFSSGFKPFKLDALAIHYQPVDRDILIQHLRTHEQETLFSQKNGQDGASLESLIVQVLMMFPDICYDEQSDLLYDLAGQMIAHLRSYLQSEDDVVNVVQYFQRQLGDFIHAQMQKHFWEKADDYKVVISKGFSTLKQEAFSVVENAQVYDCYNPLADKSKIKQMVFGGYKRCLYSVQKFDSDSERILALILDRNALKWFRPCHGQFQLYYKINNQQFEYQPDFVAETDDAIYMLEPKASRDMEVAEVVAKKEAAVQWCLRASEHNSLHGGKAWSYLLIPHDAIAENKTLQGFVAEFVCR